MDCRASHEYSGYDQHLCSGSIGLRHGNLPQILSGGGDFLQSYRSTGGGPFAVEPDFSVIP